MNDVFFTQKLEKERLLSGKYIDRQELGSALPSVDNDLIKVIIGPRRAGKSVFAMQLLKAKNFAYINFDAERLSEIKNYDEIMKGINEAYGSSRYLLFDEIQNLQKWELFVNRLQRQGYLLLLTGSSSQLLSRELATHLTGRYVQFTILPFSFGEFLTAKAAPVNVTAAIPKTEQGKIMNFLNQYIVEGGYPEIVVKNIEAHNYLRLLFESIVFKDVVRRYNVRYSKNLYDLALFLLSNYAREYSFTKLKNLADVRSVHTVQNYINYLESAYLFFSLKRFSYKAKEQLKAPSKVYVYDAGFISALRLTLSPDYGRLMENIVAVELKRRGREIYYCKEKSWAEVDFLVKQGLKITELIQVCYDVTDRNVMKKETNPLLRAGKVFSCEDLKVITWDYTREESYNNARIVYLPLWKWLTCRP
ncbi:ATP-binding protein [candidate division WOR-3 bacterium]|nr:ATP-binding protein [candidate division WOR-3 bacterium]